MSVKDLARAEKFYREVLELQEGVRDGKRNWLFLRAGGIARDDHSIFTTRTGNALELIANIKA